MKNQTGDGGGGGGGGVVSVENPRNSPIWKIQITDGLRPITFHNRFDQYQHLNPNPNPNPYKPLIPHSIENQTESVWEVRN
ncbi:hypothetical protein TorRG33x02_313980 [Trema orientale]|uniref:Uncharacterized protein n=1 Tax=Trema orientale TaxID=63057 RepID=A0A2P5BP82_TREOI|nr:hypothetical protein TorRG33x02_313980 [Trema orientale]